MAKNNNGRKIEVAEDLGHLKAETEHLRKEMSDFRKEVRIGFKEIGQNFEKLNNKVNEEITEMQLTIRNNRTFLIRIIIIALIFGSFIWIKESRDWILRLIGFVV